MVECHIWQLLTLRPSLTFLPSPNSNTNLQHNKELVPRQFILVAGSCLDHFYCNVYTMMSASAGSGVTVSPREGWLRHSATYSEADSLPPPPNPEPPGPHTTSLNILNCHLVPGTLPCNSPPKKSSKKSTSFKSLLPQAIN